MSCDSETDTEESTAGDAWLVAITYHSWLSRGKWLAVCLQVNACCTQFSLIVSPVVDVTDGAKLILVSRQSVSCTDGLGCRKPGVKLPLLITVLIFFPAPTFTFSGLQDIAILNSLPH